MANDMEKNVPELEDNIIELTDEDGVTTQFEHLATIEHLGKLYVVLMVLEGEADEENDDDEGEVLILEIAKDENGEDVYVSVEDDEISSAIFTEFLQMMDEEEAE